MRVVELSACLRVDMLVTFDVLMGTASGRGYTVRIVGSVTWV